VLALTSSQTPAPARPPCTPPCMKPTRPRGRPRKRRKGNDKRPVEQAPPCPGPSRDRPSHDANDLDDSDTGALDDWDPHAGLKPSALDECGSDVDVEMEDDLPYGEEDEIRGILVDMMVDLDDWDARDTEWLPPNEQRKLAARKTGRVSFTSKLIKTYRCSGKRKSHYHGPDVAAKSERTQRRPKHLRARRNQTKLTGFLFTVSSAHSSPAPSSSASRVSSVAVSRASSAASSRVPLALPSPVSSRFPSATPSPAPSRGSSIAGSSAPLSAAPSRVPSPVCPVKGPAAVSPVFGFQTRIDPSEEPETMCRPSGENATDPTRPVCPVKGPAAAPSPALSRAPSVMPSPARSRDPSIVPSPIPSHDPSTSPSENESDRDNGSVPSDSSEHEEDDFDIFMAAGGPEPNTKADIRDWRDLREQIKSDLEIAHKRHEPLSRINQLLILRNFATLRIKGVGRMIASRDIAQQWKDGTGVHFARQIRVLARHYQLFEHLPASNRGGDHGHSLLNDERVQTSAKTYLLALPVGDVTAAKFHCALNERILPSLGYQLRGTGLSLRTARRWLYKLGWRRTELKKGVYMDGHERPDVVEYRNKVFLPLMASLERRMVQWVPEGSGLVRIDPELAPGEKRVIAVFQDESSFHVNEFKRSVWYEQLF
jgi:hypothetical protein